MKRCSLNEKLNPKCAQNIKGNELRSFCEQSIASMDCRDEIDASNMPSRLSAAAAAAPKLCRCTVAPLRRRLEDEQLDRCHFLAGECHDQFPMLSRRNTHSFFNPA
ncbi:unnamed protein product [Cuscuta europaea]|uniref:Uncharacterized protein n=1 Tax=Cuscuta europaea TaxID=41803 RepID=A0A9P0ZY30_CUSEU|nr:unnamed protein product [Cuscuta europaea]